MNNFVSFSFNLGYTALWNRVLVLIVLCMPHVRNPLFCFHDGRHTDGTNEGTSKQHEVVVCSELPTALLYVVRFIGVRDRNRNAKEVIPIVHSEKRIAM